MQAPHEEIPVAFVQMVAEVLSVGLSGTEIVSLTSRYAHECDLKTLPHPKYPFGPINKRTALFDNLMAFPVQQQYRAIMKLCEAPEFDGNEDKRRELKLTLIKRYGHLAPDDAVFEINEALIEETQHWLSKFPEPLSLYNDALEKYKNRIFQRNLLDDLRLAIEKLLHVLLNSNRSLENQLAVVGQFVKQRGGSAEFTNMFRTLLEYYTKYQNTYVKHDDAAIEEEIEFIFELTSSFMKHLIRLSLR